MWCNKQLWIQIILESDFGTISSSAEISLVADQKNDEEEEEGKQAS